jgi:L-lactate dehydrogenase (cytochrome)
LSHPGNISEYRIAAQRRLPAPLFHYADGGAEEERTLAQNSDAFAQYRFLPTALTNVTKITLQSSILGCTTKLPFFLAPTGMSRLFHIGKELAASRAAAEAGIFYGLSTLSTTTLEDVAAAGKGPKIFQVYIFKDRGLTREFVVRCKQAKYDALCLTIDTPMAGNRERDRRTGMTMPPRFGMKSLMSFASRPRWTFDYFRDPDFRLANVTHRADAPAGKAMGLINYVNAQFDRSVTWDDAAWLAREWGGPFIIKGVISVGDAIHAKAAGATAIMISNHGGRQLDDVVAPIELVEQIRAAVGPDIELIVDGGIRRGSDIVKALCLGANACSIGRPYVYGLAVDGQQGVANVIDILHTEMNRTMTLLGCSDVAYLNSSRLYEVGINPLRK